MHATTTAACSFTGQLACASKNTPQVNFHTTLSGQAMVTMLYHRQLDEVWKEAAGRLRAKLAHAPSCQPEHVPAIVGRSRKQKVELDVSHVIETLAVNGKPYAQKQIEGAFSQPNAAVCQHMLSWAQAVTVGSQQGDLLGEGGGVCRHAMPG